MTRLIILFFAAAFLCMSCTDRNRESKLQAKVDSLQAIVNDNKEIQQTLLTVVAQLDSMDVSRQTLKSKITEEGISYQEISTRMRDIAQYVKTSQLEIAALNSKLAAPGNPSAQYTQLLKKVEQDLTARNSELSEIQQQVLVYANQNENLIHLVTLQKSEIDDKLVQLRIKQRTIAQLEAGIGVNTVDSKASSCYARALLLEEMADRTKFAPRKKRNTRLEAIELYKMAAYYGNVEAKAKIVALEKQI